MSNVIFDIFHCLKYLTVFVYQNKLCVIFYQTCVRCLKWSLMNNDSVDFAQWILFYLFKIGIMPGKSKIPICQLSAQIIASSKLWNHPNMFVSYFQPESLIIVNWIFILLKVLFCLFFIHSILQMRNVYYFQF